MTRRMLDALFLAVFANLALPLEEADRATKRALELMDGDKE